MLVSNNQSLLNFNYRFNNQNILNSSEIFNTEFNNQTNIQNNINKSSNNIQNIEFPSSNIVVKSSIYLSNLNSINNTKTAYGYSVDNKGFMGADFNKAVGINENVKIHSKTIDQLITYAENIGYGGDAVRITKKAWSNFSQIIGDKEALSGAKSLDKNSKIAHSFNTNSGILGNFTSIHMDLQSSNAANTYEQSLMPLSIVEHSELSFNPFSNYTGFTMLGLNMAFNYDDNSQIDLMNKQISQMLGIENTASNATMDIGIAFHSFIESSSFLDHSNSVALGDEYKASGKNLKDFIMSKIDMDKIKTAISKFNDMSLKQLTSLDEILFKIL